VVVNGGDVVQRNVVAAIDVNDAELADIAVDQMDVAADLDVLDGVLAEVLANQQSGDDDADESLPAGDSDG